MGAWASAADPKIYADDRVLNIDVGSIREVEQLIRNEKVGDSIPISAPFSSYS